MSFPYLNAAKAVLSRIRKPMHYVTITRLARRLYQLESNANNPEIIMSSTLSREAAHPRSVIRKVRPGVYEILSSVSADVQVCKYKCLGTRVHALTDRLRCTNELLVLRRAFYVLRQCLSAAGPEGRLKLGDGITEVEFNLLDPRTVRKRRDEFPSVGNGDGHTFVLDQALNQAGEDLRTNLDLDSIEEVVDLAVTVAEIASNLHSDGFVIATGRVKSVMVRIAPQQ